MANIVTLPDEIKIIIFDYLNGVDKIEILQVCKDFHRIGVDRKILECLDFSHNYKFKLKSHLRYIGRKVTCYLVTELNLNGIYWVPSAELRNSVIKLENLYAIHVLDTQLSYRDMITVLNKTIKVRKLAFSLRPDSCGDVFVINIETPITHLYVSFYSHQIKNLFRLLIQFSELEELWMVEPNYPRKSITLDSTMPLFNVTKIPKVSKRIVIFQQFLGSKILDNLFVDGLELYSNWETVILTHCEHSYFVVLEKRNSEKAFTTTKNQQFNLHILENNLTINDIKNIKNSNGNVSKLEGLNFDKKKYFNGDCEQKIYLQKILTEFSFTRSLRKWKSLSDCFWEEKQIGETETSLFKKRRIGVNSSKLGENNLFARFTCHTSEMEEFEIIDQDDEPIRKQLWQIDSLQFIRNWKMLKSLTITSVNIKNGKFIIDILKNCTMLHKLKIQDNSVQDNLSAHLCNGLQFATNLKQLRYERKGSIPVDKLFESLNMCTKLERIYIQCRFTNLISKSPIETLITRCENLIFFFLYISELPETVCKSIKQSIHELGLKLQQIIIIKGQTYDLNTIMYNDIPMYHIEDMVCQSNNFYSDFLRYSF